MLLLPQDLSFSKTLNPWFPLFPKQQCINSHKIPQFSRLNFQVMAGRSKKVRLDGTYWPRKHRPKYRTVNLAEYPFFRRKNPNKSHPDNFTEEEIEAVGLGYDRMVRFMEKDDPNLRHPYDWYKYGEYGPYSWRGVVVGEPIRGRFTDERVTIYGEVKDHEEWDRIEQHEMAVDYGKKLKTMDASVGFRYFWVFVRHPRWRVNEKPWQQWTLVSEVTLEAGKQRLDKWSLMGRLGNKARALITECAAWMRPDIIYVKRPVYQCRFEPQDGFFRALMPFLDPKTEGKFLFELRKEDGSSEMCTYFDGLCKIVKVSPKAFVDDVVKGYEKLSEEGKSRCLEFLLENHPVHLLHPYTKEWKVKLEEEELGCDAPDDDEDGGRGKNAGETEIVDWIEDDGDNDDNDDRDEDDEQDDVVLDLEGGDDELGIQEEESSPEDDEKYWQEEFKKAVNNSERMELFARRSVERTTKVYKKQMEYMGAVKKENIEDGDETALMESMEATEKENIEGGDETALTESIEAMEKENIEDGDETALMESMGAMEKENIEDGDETALWGKRAKVSPEEWKRAGFGPNRRRIKKSKIPPELFLRAAVRLFTYRNLVKEIVLTRHAILDGEIGVK